MDEISRTYIDGNGFGGLGTGGMVMVSSVGEITEATLLSDTILEFLTDFKTP